MSVIYWDTMLFVYLVEEDPTYFGTIERLLKKMNERGDALCTSIFTRAEALVAPEKYGFREHATRLRDYLQPPEVDILPLHHRYRRPLCPHSGRVNKVAPADAIHLASAAAAGVDLFLTNDRSLQRMIVPGIQFVAGMDVDLF